MRFVVYHVLQRSNARIFEADLRMGKCNTSTLGQVSSGNQSAMLLLEDASICTWEVN